jgi:hypothetical protein
MPWSWLFRGTGTSDWQKAQLYLADISGDRRAVIKDAKSKVARLLNDNWSWVLAVSKRLREERYLTGGEVAGLAPDSGSESASSD